MSHPVYDVASAAFAAGGVVALAGDVNGPSNANHVDTLTGPGTTIVNLPKGNTLQSSGGGNFGALIDTSGASGPIFGNLVTAGNTQLQGSGNITIRTSAGFINLLVNAGVAAGNGFYFDGDIQRFRTAGGTPFAEFLGSDFTLRMFNAAADPAIPAGGPKMYGLAGALKAIGTGGTITTMAFAEPHCPVCGCDFATEHENREKGYGYLAICLSCMANFIQEKFGPQAWIRREKV